MDPILGGALVQGGANVLGTLAGFKMQSDTGRQSAEDQMRFQERMSSTQYQRETADLRAAGLNPILAATGGMSPSAPGGSMFTPSAPDLGGAASNAGQFMVQQMQLRDQASRIAANNAAAVQGLANAMRTNLEADNVSTARRLMEAQIGLADANKRLATFQGSIMKPRAGASDQGGRILGWGQIAGNLLGAVPRLAGAFGGD